MGKKKEDVVMETVRNAFAKSGLSLDELGQRMGSDGGTAKKAAWQFLNKVSDPRISTLRRFAVAVGIPLADFFPENKRASSRK
jgi:transcriptional regulator with XRE-family HTH domain